MKTLTQIEILENRETLTLMTNSVGTLFITQHLTLCDDEGKVTGNEVLGEIHLSVTDVMNLISALENAVTQHKGKK